MDSTCEEKQRGKAWGARCARARRPERGSACVERERACVWRTASHQLADNHGGLDGTHGELSTALPVAAAKKSRRECLARVGCGRQRQAQGRRCCVIGLASSINARAMLPLGVHSSIPSTRRRTASGRLQHPHLPACPRPCTSSTQRWHLTKPDRQPLLRPVGGPSELIGVRRARAAAGRPPGRQSPAAAQQPPAAQPWSDDVHGRTATCIGEMSVTDASTQMLAAIHATPWKRASEHWST